MYEVNSNMRLWLFIYQTNSESKEVNDEKSVHVIAMIGEVEKCANSSYAIAHTLLEINKIREENSISCWGELLPINYILQINEKFI